MTTPTAIPDLTGIDAKISAVLSEAEESVTSTVPSGVIVTNPDSSSMSSPSIEDLRMRVEKLEAQMAKLAGGLGTIASIEQPKTVQSILHGGRRKTRKRKTNRK